MSPPSLTCPPHPSRLPLQVLPSRTHPEMTSSGTGGFILSGITVVVDHTSRPLPGGREGGKEGGENSSLKKRHRW